MRLVCGAAAVDDERKGEERRGEAALKSNSYLDYNWIKCIVLVGRS